MKELKEIRGVEAIEKSIDEAIKVINQNITNNDMQGYNSSLETLKSFEKEYDVAMQRRLYTQFGNEPQPVISALKQFQYDVIRHKEITNDEKQLVKIERSVKKVNVDLLKMCQYLNLNTDWQYAVEKFNQLMCIRAGQELKMSKDEIEKMSQSYFMHKINEEIKVGKTPISNNQLTKKLQEIIDEILPDNEEKPYRCNSHDLAYIIMTYAKKGKSALSLAVSKHGYMRQLVTDVLYRIVTDGKYGIEYQAKREK